MLTPTIQSLASWAEPIEMLYACHGKVKRFCRQLQILPDYIAQYGCDQAVRNDVKQILTYFNQAAPLHHDDEEQDFFPALAKHVPAAQRDIDTLAQQHTQLHQSWYELADALEKLLAGAIVNVDKALIARFVEGYAQHIAIEEPLFELGRQHLSESELHAIGKVMSERRKV